MHASYILVCDIESLETRVEVEMVLQILGSKGPHKILGDQLLMVKSVLRGTYYGWAQLYMTTVWGGMNKVILADGNLCFPSFLCPFLFERILKL